METISVGARVAYVESTHVKLGTVKALYPDLDDGKAKAFSVVWDDGYDDEGYWNTSDRQIKRVL